MKTQEDKPITAKARKTYSKPEVRKHKSVAVVSGSGSTCDYSNSSYSGGVYYH